MDKQPISKPDFLSDDFDNKTAYEQLKELAEYERKTGHIIDAGGDCLITGVIYLDLNSKML